MLESLECMMLATVLWNRGALVWYKKVVVQRIDVKRCLKRIIECIAPKHKNEAGQGKVNISIKVDDWNTECGRWKLKTPEVPIFVKKTRIQ